MRPAATAPTLLGLSLLMAPVALGSEIEVPQLGDAPQDKTPLGQAPALAHVGAALQGEGHTVAALLAEEAPTLIAAPDPSALLTGLYEENQRRPQVHEAVSLQVLTYNVGLLSRKKILGIFGLVEVPDIDARRGALPAAITQGGYDIILLQEVWEDADAQTLTAAGEAQGYRAYAGSEDLHHEHGLLILVRGALVGGEWATGELQYDAQYSLEYWPGPDIKRGAIWVSFQHKTLGTVRVVDTHLTPFPGYWQTRLAQSRELALTLNQVGSPEDLVIVGGDMNAGPYYEKDVYQLADGESQGGWWANAISYGAFLHYLGGVDLFAMGTAAQDVALGKGMPNDPKAAAAHPMGDTGWCEKTPHVVFTATDCNSLYFRNYAGTEWPARLDHLVARDPTGRIKVSAAGLVFTERRDIGTAQLTELSDHYGVAATLAVTPAGP